MPGPKPHPYTAFRELYTAANKLQRASVTDEQQAIARKLYAVIIAIEPKWGDPLAPRLMKDKPKQVIIDAINLGAAAFAAGVVHTDNPYDRGDPRNVAWNGGWNRAWYDAQHPAVNSVE